MTDSGRTLGLKAAGVALALIAVAALLLPLAQDIAARRTLGLMLLLAGIIELAAVALRRGQRLPVSIAAGATVLAGLRLLLDPSANFFEVLNLIILWLVVRAVALGVPAFRTPGPIGPWVGLAAAVDLLLAIALLAGLPIALIVVGLFGPTRPISATFAWVIALSFLAAAIFLFASAVLERSSADRGDRLPD